MDKTVKTTKRLSFSQIEPNLQLGWDSTSLGALKRCPRYYQYNIIEGHVTRGQNAHLAFGSFYNNSLVKYNKSRAKGISHENAVFDAVRYALTETWDKDLNRPWVSDIPGKSRETLVRTVIWYLDKFSNDSCQTIVLKTGESAVELSFRLEIEETSSLTGESYLLCGYLDRLVDFTNSDWIMDWKTTKSQLDEKYFSEYTPNNQVSQYSFAGKIISGRGIKGVIIDAVQLGVTFSRFQRAQINRTDAQLEEWLRDSLTFIQQNETYVSQNYWPQNDAACGLYGGCPYRVICSKSPELRPQFLEGLFTKRFWDPLVMREI